MKLALPSCRRSPRGSPIRPAGVSYLGQQNSETTLHDPPIIMSGMPSNIAPADVAASELPDGFSLAGGPGGAAASPANDQAAQRDAQRQAILEQAMTPEALARLRRVKVNGCSFVANDSSRI